MGYSAGYEKSQQDTHLRKIILLFTMTSLQPGHYDFNAQLTSSSGKEFGVFTAINNKL